MTPLHAAAIQYATAGLPVFPIIPRSKAPATKNGFLDATTDLDLVNKWWSKAPYSIGLAVPDGMVVVDFDAMAHEYVLDTPETEMPDTLSCITPGKGGGRHFYFKLPPGVVIGNRVRPMEGMDTRAKGGYVLAPPSVHPEGGQYAWEDGDIPSKEQFDSLPDVPAWIISVCQDSAVDKGGGDKVDLMAMLHGVSEGGRQVALFRAACSMRHRGFSRDETLIILQGITHASEGTGYKRKPNLPGLVDRVWRRYDVGPRSGIRTLAGGWALSDLMSADLGSMNWFVDSLLGPGLGIIVADAKVGKSMACADLCLSMATGELAWCRYKVPRSRGVLYLDLEQNPLSGQDRWKRMLGGRVAPENIHVHFEWPRMDEGGLEKIVEALQRDVGIEVVVVDILSLFWPNAQSGSNAYHADYGTLGKLRKVANDFGILLLLVHHTNKSGTSSGSMAMVGGFDYEFHMYREQMSSFASIMVKGKNIQARELAMAVDLERFRWNVVGIK